MPEPNHDVVATPPAKPTALPKNSKDSKVADAKKKVEAKQEAVTKANELATKAHAELMVAQKELGVVENAPEVVPVTADHK